MKIFFLLVLSTLTLISTKPSETTKPNGSYYVLAKSGLRLRAAADLDSQKKATIPFGAKVELIEAASAADMLVDNLPGGMAKVQYGDLTGFVFDGYLCKMPVRQKIENDLNSYKEWSRGKGAYVLFENCERDYDGYYQSEQIIIPYITDWAEAYLLAKTLFDLPFDFPKASTKAKETFENPNKGEYIWEDSLTIERDATGKVKSMVRYLRSEGGGITIVIEEDEQQNSLRISKTEIAD
ncbi:MAG: SH3 domain-containing protein [Bacteroidota bacterium]